MAQNSLFMLKVQLNPNQPTNHCLDRHAALDDLMLQSRRQSIS